MSAGFADPGEIVASRQSMRLALQLEAALASYPGTLLLVTHDRRMLEAVTVNRRLEVADGTVTSR